MNKISNKHFKKINTPLDRFILLFILLIYIFISLIVLPKFDKRNFLFFSNWVLFSSLPQGYVYDITWDNGKTFLLRDHRQKITFPFIKLNRFAPLLIWFSEENHKIIKADFYSELKTLCNCQELKIFMLKGFLSDHILYGKQLEVEKQIIL